MILILQIFVLLYVIAIISIGISLLWSEISGIPYVPSKLNDVETIFAKLNLPHGTKVVDLGSGDGRVIFLAASKFGWHGTGVEINKIFIWYCQIKKLITKTANVHFQAANFLKIPLNKYQVIYIYGFPNMMNQLLPKFLKECSKGTWIISNTFVLPNKKENFSTGSIHAYKI